RHKVVNLCPKRISDGAFEIIQYYKLAHFCPSSSVSQVIISNLHWCPPKEPWYKLNVDAAVNLKGGLVELGAVVRNTKGEVMAAATWSHTFPEDVEFVEALAVYEGLKLARSVGLCPLVIESDCRNVVELIMEKTKSYCEIGWLVAEIQALIKDGCLLNLFL
ncbi:Ribonuclease H-like domain containing protein, partial [Melia azedarach]